MTVYLFLHFTHGFKAGTLTELTNITKAEKKNKKSVMSTMCPGPLFCLSLKTHITQNSDSHGKLKS